MLLLHKKFLYIAFYNIFYEQIINFINPNALIIFFMNSRIRFFNIPKKIYRIKKGKIEIKTQTSNLLRSMKYCVAKIRIYVHIYNICMSIDSTGLNH